MVNLTKDELMTLAGTLIINSSPELLSKIKKHMNAKQIAFIEQEVESAKYFLQQSTRD
jgi:hypothetical protein